MKKTKILALILLVVLCVGCIAACNKVPQGLQDAKDYLYAQYRDKDGSNTPADFDRVAAVVINGTRYPITWTASVTTEGHSDDVKVVTKDANTVTVDVNEKATEDVSYTLTATIEDADGNTVTVTFNHKIPMFKELTYAEYIAAEDGSTVVVKGVVTAIVSKDRGNTVNGFYMQDSDGGYYIYGMVEGTTPETLGLQVGMTVRAAGEKDLYSGTHEVKDAGVEIIDSNITTVTPADYTEIFTNATDLSAEALVSKQSTVVTVKGVTVKENGGSDGSYYYFELAGKKTYVRISSSTCPLTAAEISAFKAGFAENFGKTGDVTGLICLYDGKFYLTPISGTPFTNLSLPQLSDAEAVAFEKESVSFETTIGYDGKYELQTAGAAYTDVVISWALDKEYTGVSVADGHLVVELQPEAQTVKLIATLTRGEATDTREFTVAIDAATTQEYLPVAMTDVAEGTYKLTLYQTTLGQQLYFDGGINSSEFLTTTEKAAKAADVVIAKVADKDEYTIKVGEKYLEIYKNTNNKIRPHLADTATTNWVWDADLKVFTMTIEGTAYYLGTYNNFNTISASATSYISGDKAANVGVSQFVAEFATLVEADYAPVAMADVAEGTYKLTLYQTTLGQQLYFDGGINSSEFLTTTEKAAKAADVVIAKVADKDEYTIKVGEKYLEIYKNTNNKIRPHLADTATTNWVWDADLKVFTMTIEGTAYYLGTYNNFNTISASATSYISGDKAANVGVSQFVAEFATLELKEVAFQGIEEAKEGTYKFALYQATLGQQLYFDGGINSSEFLTTTEKAAKAADVVIAKVADKDEYTIKVGEKYLEIYKNTNNKIRPHLADTATTNWVWDADLKVFTMTIEGTAYYLGTYNNFNTISASATSYISGDKAANVGVSQFVGQFGNKDFVKDEAPVQKTDEELLAEIKVPTQVSADFDLAATATWAIKEGTAIALEGNTAKVTRGAEDATVVLTATIGEAHQDFTVVVKAKAVVSTNYTHTFKSGEIKTGLNTWSGAEWNVTTGTAYYGWDSNTAKGVQIGSKADPSREATLTSDSFTSVKSIKLNLSTASQATATVKVYVGDTLVGKETTLTTTATDYTFTLDAAATGEIKIVLTQPETSKALYIKSIDVTVE